MYNKPFIIRDRFTSVYLYSNDSFILLSKWPDAGFPNAREQCEHNFYIIWIGYDQIVLYYRPKITCVLTRRVVEKAMVTTHLLERIRDKSVDILFTLCLVCVTWEGDSELTQIVKYKVWTSIIRGSRCLFSKRIPYK